MKRLLPAILVLLALAVWLSRYGNNRGVESNLARGTPAASENRRTDEPPPGPRLAEAFDEARSNYIAFRNRTQTWMEDPVASNALAKSREDPHWFWKQPINFWGIVLDEVDHPVDGASVTFTWNDMSTKGTSTEAVSSDADGRITLRDKVGYVLGVQVTKQGFYRTRLSSLSFNYAEPWAPHFHVPDVQRPVILRLRRKGFPSPMIRRERLEYFASETNPVVRVDLLGQREVNEEPWDLAFVMSHGPEVQINGQRRYDWSIEVTANGGGLIPYDEEFPFLAPEDGYQPVLRASMRAEDPNWAGYIRQQCFFKTREGANYGRIDFEISPFPRRQPPRILIHQYFLNPAGSRNLEYDMDLDVGEKYYVPR